MNTIQIPTEGNTDIIDISADVQNVIDKEKFKNGIIHLFVIGSTASLSTCEPDENSYDDLRETFEKIASYKNNWKHHQTWGDNNGASHIRAAILGPSLTIPVQNGLLLLGTWQKIILLDFDTRPRNREIVINLISDK